MEKKNIALLWAAIQIILTAALILLTKYVFNLGIEPLNFSYQILLISVFYLFVYALLKEPKMLINVDKRSMVTIIFIGIIGGGIAYGLGFLGLQKSTAINYAFLIQTTVFFTPVLAYFFLKEHLKPYKTALIFVLLIGAYLVLTNGKIILPKTGDLFILLSSLAFSISVILTKITLKKVPTITFSIYRALFGGLSLLTFLVLINKISFDVNWLWAVIVGFVIAVGIYSMNKVLEYATASYMQMMYTSVPIITTIFAYFIFKESMTIIQIIGGIMIILSGFFVHKLNI